MKIAFLRPNLYARRSADRTEPPVFATLAGCAPDDCAFRLYDEQLKTIPADLDVDLVG